MNQNKSFYSMASTLQENSTQSHTQYFSKLPQIDKMKSIHEENMRKERKAQEAYKKHFKLYTEEKELYSKKSKLKS